ncbi:MAG TPA: hypothetical protein VGM51_16345 [Armatimonadota bacterium]|jgi:uncharacterized membrane protein YkgB
MKQHYTPDEANAILGHAVKNLPLPGDMTHEQLVQTAAEVGVTPEQLEAAEAEYRRNAETREFWAAYRVYRLRKLMAILPVVLVFFFIVGLRGAHDTAGPEMSWVVLAMLIGIGAAVARTATCRGTTALGERKLRRFIYMRRRMGLPVPPEITPRDY